MTEEAVLAACFAILFANLIVLGLTLKLYTEHFKDRAMEKRRG